MQKVIKSASLRTFLVLIFLAFADLCFGSGSAPALYEAILRVQPQTAQTELFKQGLLQVLETMSGENPSLQEPEIQKALNQVVNFVEQYAYQGNTLIVKYDAKQINQLLQQSGKAVWGQQRPKVIVWLAIEEGTHQRRLVGAESDPELQALLNEISKQRGLPLILPLMDLEDISAVTVTDVWGQFGPVLQEASVRYGAQAVLIGRATHLETGTWQGNWQLLTTQNETPSVWAAQGQSLEAMLTQGITNASQYLVAHYGVKREHVATREKPFLISIQNIRSAQDFSKVEAYLQSFSQIKQLKIQQVLENKAVFEITPNEENSRQALVQAMRLDPHLKAHGPDLSYQWIP